MLQRKLYHFISIESTLILAMVWVISMRFIVQVNSIGHLKALSVLFFMIIVG